MRRQPTQHTTLNPVNRDDATVGIVDDEPLSRSGMHRLTAATPGFRVVGEASSGVEALALVRQRTPEILLLDVQMPGLDGFGVLRQLGEGPRPTIVFVTAHDEHALRAFDVHAVDYLLKPYTDERFREALQLARRIHRSRKHAAHAERLEALVRTLAAERTEALARTREAERAAAARAGADASISIRTHGRIEVVALSDVAWIEADGSYVRLHAVGRSWLHREALATLWRRLDSAQFVRVHRSAIVARSAIRRVVRLRSGSHALVLTTGDRVRTSRKGWRDVRAALPASP
jgi:two-component system LytT family response regulator